MMSGLEALECLREGNRRFVAHLATHENYPSKRRRGELAVAQEPHAIILGCSDSRVPIEFIFDQGFGDLFVIRVAGNVVQPSQVGSVEFAASQFSTRLVVVLGHSNCGAVETTLQELQRPSEHQSRGLASIVDRIKPAVHGLLETDLVNDPQQLAQQAVRDNIHASVRGLQEGSDILRQLISEEGLLVVGAEYSLKTGRVDFFEGAPAGG